MITEVQEHEKAPPIIAGPLAPAPKAKPTDTGRKTKPRVTKPAPPVPSCSTVTIEKEVLVQGLGVSFLVGVAAGFLLSKVL